MNKKSKMNLNSIRINDQNGIEIGNHVSIDGPIDNNDYIGGNYVSTINISTSLFIEL